MNFTVRALVCTCLSALFIILFSPRSTAAQTDSTKTDSLRTAGSPGSGGQIVPTTSSGDKAAWNPRNKYVTITAPTLFNRDLRGRVSAVAGDTLIIEHLVPGGSNYARRESKYERVPFSEVTRCREQIGSRNNIILGTLIGAATGFSVMTLVVTSDEDHKDFASLSSLIIGLSTAGGAVLGGVIGAFTKTEKWQEVPVGNVRLGLTPQSGTTTGIRLSLRF